MEEDTPDAPVLVCVVPRPADLERAAREGWYRIPLARAPRRVSAAYLAFYQTGAFGAERWSVRRYAAVRGVAVALRSELLPEAAGHPRAGERYYRFALGPLQELPAPLPSRRLRRVTFIPTTLGRLRGAGDLGELWGARAGDLGELWGSGIGRRAVW